MTEEAPHYGDRQFVCEVCRQVFVPSKDEAEAMAMLERDFGLPQDQASLLCAECLAKRMQ